MCVVKLPLRIGYSFVLWLLVSCSFWAKQTNIWSPSITWSLFTSHTAACKPSIHPLTVPVVTDWYFLAHCSIAHMIQVGFDKLREEVLQIVRVYKRRANMKHIWNMKPSMRQGISVQCLYTCFWAKLKKVCYLHTAPPAEKTEIWKSARYGLEEWTGFLDTPGHLKQIQTCPRFNLYISQGHA